MEKRQKKNIAPQSRIKEKKKSTSITGKRKQTFSENKSSKKIPEQQKEVDQERKVNLKKSSKKIPEQQKEVDQGRKVNLKKNSKKIPEQQKEEDQGRKIDKICWLCHKEGFEIICSKCPRVFHIKCSGLNWKEGMCSECTPISETDAETSKDLMLFLIARVFSIKGPKQVFLKWPEVVNDKIFEIMDKKKLNERLVSDHYRNARALFSDFKWMIHNCSIVYGEKSANSTIADKLLKSFEYELSILEACADCALYRYSKLYRVNSIKNCTNEHQSVWVKVKGHPDWPAKVLKINENKKAKVMFYGTHNFSEVAEKNYFFNTEEQMSQKRVDFCSAISELFSQWTTQKKSEVSLSAHQSIQTQTDPVFVQSTLSSCNRCKEIDTALSHFYHNNGNETAHSEIPLIDVIKNEDIDTDCHIIKHIEKKSNRKENASSHMTDPLQVNNLTAFQMLLQLVAMNGQISNQNLASLFSQSIVPNAVIKTEENTEETGPQNDAD